MAAVAAAVLAGPVSAGAPARAELGATTTVVARSSGYADVVLARDATLSPAFNGNPDVAFSGTGRMVGLWLTRLDPESDNHYSGLAAYRLPAFAGGKTFVYGRTTPEGTCTAKPNDTLPLYTECTAPTPKAIVLHKGRYRMTVLADGSPLSVRLTLHGLGATRRTLQPSRPLASTQQKLPRLDGVGDTLVTFGATLPVSDYAEVFVIAGAKFTSQPVFREASACLRRDSGAAPPLAYGPQCVGGEGASYEYQVEAAGQQRSGWGGYATASSEPPAGKLGVGGSFGDSGGVTFGEALGVALAYP